MNDYYTIISTTELEENLHHPDWVIVDCRFNLMDPDRGELDYQQSHIPGAVYAHLDRDLSGKKEKTLGRHPLPSPDEVRKVFSQLGISDKTQVIAYDDTSGSFAARLWFMLKLYGHTKVAVLDGGISKWLAEGLPIEEGKNINTPQVFHGEPDTSLFVTTNQMEKIVNDPYWKIIDARAAERYAGESEPIDPVAGHIPNAVNRFHGLNLNSNGVYLPKEQLRSEFLELLDNTDPQKTVVYCGSGVTSCHHLIAMKLAGLTPAKLYVGSWSEWIRDSKHPIRKSKTP